MRPFVFGRVVVVRTHASCPVHATLATSVHMWKHSVCRATKDSLLLVTQTNQTEKSVMNDLLVDVCSVKKANRRVRTGSSSL